MSIDLKPFCDPEYPTVRWDIRRPFTLNQRVYATDGFICVRVPGHGNETGKFPPVEDQFNHDGWRQPFHPWPAPDLRFADGLCKTCDGQGHDGDETEACKHCKGHGALEGELCDECGGSGADIGAPCKQCNGNGSYDQPIYQVMAGLPEGWYLRTRYDQMIRGLPNVTFTVYTPPKASDPPRILFRFDGGEGVVMPAETNEKNPARHEPAA